MSRAEGPLFPHQSDRGERLAQRGVEAERTVAVLQGGVQASLRGSGNSGGEAIINSVSCASADRCSAGGQYTDSSDSHQAFVVNET
jgi:hypothetical protein